MNAHLYVQMCIRSRSLPRMIASWINRIFLILRVSGPVMHVLKLAKLLLTASYRSTNPSRMHIYIYAYKQLQAAAGDGRQPE